MNVTCLRAALALILVSLSLSAPVFAQDPPLIVPEPAPILIPAPEAPLPPQASLDVPEPVPFNSLELTLSAGVSVATIHTDGAAATGFLPGIAAAFHRGMVVTGLRFDVDPSKSVASSATSAGEDRSGWHLGAFIGPSFALSDRLRLDLNAEVGVHRAEDTLVETSGATSTTYATVASLPYFGFRPALSMQFGQGKYTGAAGVAAFLRIDASQRQASGLPDDGGHQLGLEVFASFRLALL